MSSSDAPVIVEPLRPHDLQAAMAIQKDAYPPFLVEGEAAFLSRINLAASYCLAARHGQALCGYLLAHGWKRQSPPPLGALLPDDVPSEVLFIHDLAVSSSSRGLRLGERLITHLFELAARDGLRSAELIAVEGAAEYWRRLGFVEGAVSGELAGKLATYGPDARWMTRERPPMG